MKSKGGFFGPLFAALAAFSAAAQAGPLAYVGNGDNTVQVVDTATGTVVATIGGFTAAYGVSLSPDGSRAYVADAGGTVKVINTATNSITASIPITGDSASITVSPDGSRVYVGNRYGGTVSVIDAATNGVIATIPTTGDGPHALSLNPSGDRLFASSSSGFNIIDTATNAVVGLMPGAFSHFATQFAEYAAWAIGAGYALFSPGSGSGGSGGGSGSGGGGGGRLAPSLNEWGAIFLVALVLAAGLRRLAARPRRAARSRPPKPAC